MPYTARGLVFNNTAESVHRARSLVRTILVGWDYSDDVIERALVIASELATNAVTHALNTPRFKLICDTEANLLTIGVIDQDTREPSKTDAADDDEHGRGLRVVEALADEWGWEPCEHGKIVYGRLHASRPLQADISKPLCFT